jgi:tetratricopeptide (TPR) repeat protein
VRSLDQALELQPRSAWAWAHRGNILCENLGRYREAIADFDRALELEPDYVWALAHRGATHERLDDYAKAEADLLRACSLKPGYMWAFALLGRIYQATGRYEQALDWLERLIERDPSILPHWREERGLLRMMLRRHEEADRYFLIALEAKPKDRFASYNLTVNRVLWRGLAEARPDIERFRAEVLSSPAPDAHARIAATYELGGMAALEGKCDEALQRLSEAIQQETGMVLLTPSAKRARVDLAWSGLHSDERFQALLQVRGCPTKAEVNPC